MSILADEISTAVHDALCCFPRELTGIIGDYAEQRVLAWQKTPSVFVKDTIAIPAQVSGDHDEKASPSSPARFAHVVKSSEPLWRLPKRFSIKFDAPPTSPWPGIIACLGSDVMDISQEMVGAPVTFELVYCQIKRLYSLSVIRPHTSDLACTSDYHEARLSIVFTHASLVVL